MRPVIAPIDELVRNATSLEDLRGKLTGLIATMDTDAMTELLARLAFGARINAENGY